MALWVSGAYKLKRNWSASLRVTAVLGEESGADAALGYLEILVKMARSPTPGWRNVEGSANDLIH